MRSLIVRGKRIRGNTTSRVVRERRTAKALDLLGSGSTMTQVAKILKCNRTTVWRNLRNLRAEFAAANQQEIETAVRPLFLRAQRGDLRAVKLLMEVLDKRRPEEEEEV